MRFFKRMGRYPFIVLIIVSTLILTVMAYTGGNTVYAGYSVNLLKNPKLSVVFEGMKDKNYPWKGNGDNEIKDIASADKGKDGSEGNNTSGDNNNSENNNTPGKDASEETGEGTKDKGNKDKGNKADNTGSADKGSTDKGTSADKGTSGDKGTSAGNDGSKENGSDNSHNAGSGSDTSGNGTQDNTDKPSDNKDSGNNSTGGSKNHAGGNKGDNTDKAPGNNGGDNSTTKGTAGGKGDNPGSKDNTGETGKPGSGASYQFAAVKKSYFNDALFIGDSRTVGLADYSGWKNPTFYADVGLTIYDVFDKKIAEVGGKKVTIEDALKKKSFQKIYIMLGINEMGTGNAKTFTKAYKEVVDRIKELQPDAIIFVEGIMNVSKKKSDTDPIFNNKNIKDRNEHLALLADNRKIFYIDVNEAITDSTGGIPAKYTFDNIHLKAAYYSIWTDFLLKHGVVEK